MNVLVGSGDQAHFAQSGCRSGDAQCTKPTACDVRQIDRGMFLSLSARMTSRKRPSKDLPRVATKSPSSKAARDRSAGRAPSRSTVSGPAEPDPDLGDRLARRMEGAQFLAASMPHNLAKAAEHGEAARRPIPGGT